MNPWNLKEQMLAAIQNRGGFVNCHAHFDKAFYIDKQGLDKSMLDMEVKWNMSDGLKRASTQEHIEERIERGLQILIDQGVNLTCSFVDAYEAVDHRAIDAAIVVKKKLADKINLLTITQPLGGLVNKEAIDLYEAITDKADIVGVLPSKDRPNVEAHYDVLFSVAKNQNKPMHVHIDQENNPNERDTETLIEQTVKHGYQGRVTAIHSISLSAQPKEYRSEVYKKLVDSGIAVVVCPSAALAMRQLDEYTAPVHNSIANVPEMLNAGVLVGLGVDNVYDYYQPFVDGDMWTELRMLQEACRYYNFYDLVNIASVNGRTILERR